LERSTKLLKHEDHKENFAPRGSGSEKGEVAHPFALLAQIARSVGEKNSLFFVFFVFRSLPLSAAKGGLCVLCVEAVRGFVVRS
jgi:hypothetical protein